MSDAPKPPDRSAWVRPLEPEDLAGVQEVDREAFSVGWSHASFAGESAREHARGWCWVAIDRGSLVGYLLSFRVVDEVHIVRMAVAPRVQRTHIGSALLARVIDEAKRGSVASIWLEVRVSNASAHALYAAHGFVEVGVRKAYYTDEHGVEDARVLVRRIEP
jgi:ribosomal-protein-alanine N-acetyltransferase